MAMIIIIATIYSKLAFLLGTFRCTNIPLMCISCIPWSHLNWRCFYATHNMQVMDPAQVPINKLVHKENMVNIHNGVLYSHTENKIMSFADKWMELEKRMQSEISQTQEHKGWIFSHMWKLERKKWGTWIFNTIEGNF